MGKFRKFIKYFFAFSVLFLTGAGVFLSYKSHQKPTDLSISIPAQIQQPQTNQVDLPADSIPKMAERDYNGSDLKLIKVLAKTNTYTSYAITYKSEGLTISGVLNIPSGNSPFPILILNHGYFDPNNYQSGQVLRREQNFFASHGYATLLSDYRGYGSSDNDPANDVRPRSGYVEDVLNAVSAIKKSDLKMIDKDNIGMLGHSMGGGITLNVMVTKPDTAKAYVLLAPINADYKMNFDRWVKDDFPDDADQFYRLYGTYEQNPQIWESFSAKNYFDRIDAPILLQQGTDDDQVPVQWSRDLAGDLRAHGKTVTYYEYIGENHVFMTAQDLAMQRTLEFFDKILKQNKL